MNVDKNNITKEQFQAYKQLRDAGFINMLDVVNGTMLTGLSLSVYRAIIANYDYLSKKYEYIL